MITVNKRKLDYLRNFYQLTSAELINFLKGLKSYLGIDKDWLIIDLEYDRIRFSDKHKDKYLVK